MTFKLNADYEPAGDQPQAIEGLVQSLHAKNKYQTLLGVTGSGKTYSMANVIEKVQRPTLIISHNKTLAAQLYSEFKNFFPDNAVEYFVSYYDYYQPEAYIAQTDTFIEKDSSINEEIGRLRLSAASSLMSRDDVIVIASVSCIYGLGSPKDFEEMMIQIKVGSTHGRDSLLEQLVENLYERNDIEFTCGKFRVRGDTVDIFPSYTEIALRVEFWGDDIESIALIQPLTGEVIKKIDVYNLYPANPYIIPRDRVRGVIKEIRAELEERVVELERNNKLIEAQRIRMRTEYDLELLEELGFCNGIENYSRYMGGRKEGQRPWCLLDFFPEDFLLFIDESHVTLPQIRAMYNGDRARKAQLIDYGFRLPSALDNRPLKEEEFKEVIGQTVFVSATPAAYEKEVSSVIVEQVIRPTGLLDPDIKIKPIKGQVEDLIGEIHKAVEKKERVLVTTLTKRMAEDLADYVRELGIKVEYLHSDIDAVERVEILRNLRQGEFDVLIGINLLREGLDLPEVGLVAVLDADKEGFLRSEASLMQTAGRAARHENGRVIFYADVITGSIQRVLDTTGERREKQMSYNKTHGITPKSVKRAIQKSLNLYKKKQEVVDPVSMKDAKGDAELAAIIAELEAEMLTAAEKLQFEKAASLRDQINFLKGERKKKK